MTKQEFEKRTGVEVSEYEFECINFVYVMADADCDKDVFCKMWKKMNANRVKNAKVERMQKAREEAYRDALHKWFNKWNNTQAFWDNYNVPLAYTKISVYEVQAMAHAEISTEGSLSDIHFKVGQYLGIYREL